MVAGGALVAAGWWIYDRFVTDPLYCFWRKGAWWRNIEDADLCSQLTNGRITGFDYASDPAMRLRCSKIINDDFESWNATVATILYFSVVGFVTMHVVCQCCCVRPILRALTRPNAVVVQKNE